MNSTLSPNRSLIQGCNSPILEKSIRINQNRFVIKKSAFWGGVNVLLLSLLIYDLSYACPYYLTFFHYAEFTIVFILCVNIIYHVVKIICASWVASEQITITPAQKLLLGVRDSDPHFRVINNGSETKTALECSQNQSLLNTTPLSALNKTPMNMTAASWKSTSPNESSGMNYSLSSSSWTYHKPSSPFEGRTVLRTSIVVPGEIEDIINDEKSLEKYLKEREAFEQVQRISSPPSQPSNLLSSFWSHPATKTAQDMSHFLRKCQYQMSSFSPNKSSPKAEEKSPQSGQTPTLEAWTRINVDVVALMQWNENLRKWLSQTILERLVSEIDYVNTWLDNQGLGEAKVGTIGLERLRKTAQISAVSQGLPSLHTLVPFLEVTPNQEYLERRIRELAKGGCMSNFKWNGGSQYLGKPWDDSLPSDCAIVMHLFATYLDTQLLPVPNAPDRKPFSGHHYIKHNESLPQPLMTSNLLIQQVTEKPPHYRVVVGENIYEMGKGYNNFFHSILFFLYQVNVKEQGMLGRVNLGRAGLNMLWIIDQ